MAADVARYGPDIPTETELKLLGNVEGKRELELGGGAQAAIAFAKQGAHAIAVDSSPERLAELRRGADEEEVKVELHESDLADIAFVRADSIDLAFSSYAFGDVDLAGRVGTFAVAAACETAASKGPATAVWSHRTAVI